MQYGIVGEAISSASLFLTHVKCKQLQDQGRGAHPPTSAATAPTCSPSRGAPTSAVTAPTRSPSHQTPSVPSSQTLQGQVGKAVNFKQWIMNLHPRSKET